MFFRIFVTALWAGGFAPTVFAQIPDWYTTHKNLKYPSEMYLLGVGAGSGANGIEAAKKAAQTDLVSQIRVQVQAQVKNVSESFQSGKDEQLFSDFRSSARTAVSDEILGMEVAETTTDEATGTSYALVVLERDKYCENLRNELDAGWKQADDLRKSSTVYVKQGKLNEALQSLFDARAAVAPLLTKQALYNSVSNTPYKPAAIFGPSVFTSDIRKLLSSVRLTKKSGDNQKGRVGESFPEPFVVNVTVKTDSVSVPVIGNTVVFETSDNAKVGEATTDEQGVASLTTTVRAMKGNGIRVRLAFKKLDRDFEQNILSSAAYFTWKAEASRIAFALKIDAKSTAMTTALKNTVSAAITRIGYKVVNSSKFLLAVSVETGQSSKVEGMAGTMYTVTANVSATLTDKDANNTLGTATFSGKGVARSESEAAEKAVNSVKMDDVDISNLLQKALEN